MDYPHPQDAYNYNSLAYWPNMDVYGSRPPRVLAAGIALPIGFILCYLLLGNNVGTLTKITSASVLALTLAMVIYGFYPTSAR